jgi:hypothetical protein
LIPILPGKPRRLPKVPAISQNLLNEVKYRGKLKPANQIRKRSILKNPVPASAGLIFPPHMVTSAPAFSSWTRVDGGSYPPG